MSSSTELTATTSSHALFASRLCSIRDQPTSALLDSSSGLALLFAQVCREKAQSAADGVGALRDDGFREGVEGDEEGGDDDDDDPDAWALEARTWELLHALYSQRLLTSPKSQRSRVIMAGDEGEQKDGDDDDDNDDQLRRARKTPYETPLSTVQEVLDADAGLAELQVLREWLSAQLQPLHVVEVRKGYLPFTKNHLRAEKRLGKGGGATPSKSSSGLASFGMALGGTAKGKGVTALDPDAANRGRGVLEMEDQAYEKAVHRTLFEYVRGAKLDAAIDLAGQIDQSWRAASLRGATLHWRPGLDDSEELDEGMSEPLGNRNRTLWKAVCRQVAGQSRLDEYERALYGALSGDLPSVLTVSRDWESQLWAHVNAKLESAIEEALDRSSTWWSQGADRSFPDAKAETGAVVLNELSLREPNAGPPKVSPDPTSALKDIFARLAQVEQHDIHLHANNPYRTVQRAVVLDELNDLLAHVESRLADMRGSVDPRQYGRLVRFFAHLVLFLRLLNLDRPPPDLVCNGILRAYVEVLEFSGQDDLVALYASSLEPESATQSYAHFLKLIDYASSLEHRRNALAKAREHDLDVAAVARTTVAMIFDETFPGIPSYVASQAQVTEFDASLDPLEERMISSIDWLTFDESTHRDAIVQSNALLRLFLAAGRLHAARKLLDNLPVEIVGRLAKLDLPRDEAVEHVHFRNFFEALNAHVRYAEVWSQRPLGGGNAKDARGIGFNGLGRKDQKAWTARLAEVCRTAQQSIRQVLEMAWLKIDVEGEDLSAERRLQELARIRQIYIPELVLRLHFMLYETREALPSHLETLISLPNLVADERHKLYLEFITRDDNRLGEYLGFVRTASLACLEKAEDPFQIVQPTLTSTE